MKENYFVAAPSGEDWEQLSSQDAINRLDELLADTDKNQWHWWYCFGDFDRRISIAMIKADGTEYMTDWFNCNQLTALVKQAKKIMQSVDVSDGT